MRKTIIACGFIAAMLSLSSQAEAQVDLSVSPASSFEPATITFTIRTSVQKAAEICLQFADDAGFERGSCWPARDDLSSWRVPIKNIPAGNYKAYVMVTDGTELKRSADKEFVVLSRRKDDAKNKETSR